MLSSPLGRSPRSEQQVRTGLQKGAESALKPHLQGALQIWSTVLLQNCVESCPRCGTGLGTKPTLPRALLLFPQLSDPPQESKRYQVHRSGLREWQKEVWDTFKAFLSFFFFIFLGENLSHCVQLHFHSNFCSWDDAEGKLLEVNSSEPFLSVRSNTVCVRSAPS